MDAKSFATKLDLLKRSRFLTKSVLRDFYFKVILPSVKYGLILGGGGGGCCNPKLLDSIERLHCRASRIIFNLPRDMPSKEVLAYDRWPTIFLYYKIDIFKAHNDGLPELLSNNIYIERRNGYSLRSGDCLSVPRFETRFMKDSLAYRGTVLWNTICLNENGFSHMSNKDRSLIRTKDYFKDFKFDTTSASTMRHRNAPPGRHPQHVCTPDPVPPTVAWPRKMNGRQANPQRHHVWRARHWFQTCRRPIL